MKYSKTVRVRKRLKEKEIRGRKDCERVRQRLSERVGVFFKTTEINGPIGAKI